MEKQGIPPQDIQKCAKAAETTQESLADEVQQMIDRSHDEAPKRKDPRCSSCSTKAPEAS